FDELAVRQAVSGGLRQPQPVAGVARRRTRRGAGHHRVALVEVTVERARPVDDLAVRQEEADLDLAVADGRGGGGAIPAGRREGPEGAGAVAPQGERAFQRAAGVSALGHVEREVELANRQRSRAGASARSAAACAAPGSSTRRGESEGERESDVKRAERSV